MLNWSNNCARSAQTCNNKMSVVPFYVPVYMYVCDVADTRRDVVPRYKIVIVRVLQCCRVRTKLFYTILSISLSCMRCPCVRVCRTEGECQGTCISQLPYGFYCVIVYTITQ